MLLFAAFAVVGLAQLKTFANGQEAAAKTTKESRWHGQIIRIDKDASTMDVRKGTIEEDPLRQFDKVDSRDQGRRNERIQGRLGRDLHRHFPQRECRDECHAN